MKEVYLPVTEWLTELTTSSSLAGEENKTVMGQVNLKTRERPRKWGLLLLLLKIGKGQGNGDYYYDSDVDVKR